MSGSREATGLGQDGGRAPSDGAWQAQPEVAVVGIACRFPGGDGKEAFWDLLRGGGDGVGPVPPGRWEPDAFYSPDGAPGTMNNRAGGFLPRIDALDHEFFAIAAEDAAALDPHQRLLLECAWHAVEDAGVDPHALSTAPCGVYLGVMGNEWVWRTAAARTGPDFTSRQGAGTGHHMAANRLSYQLNLRGPSLAVDTACSSSLVAVHLAARALADGECDYALAGGVNAILEPINGIYFTLLGLSAPDGRCKPFNAEADGMGRGEGVGLVMLRRLADARADGQRVYAVVKGGAISHNGRSNGITAPARWGQQEAIRRAYRHAGVGPSEIDFVEAHGTGTLIGDAIEINALRAVHSGDRAAPCAIGSVKGNIGHTEGAAGIASFVKAVLAVYHRLLPPTVHGDPVNPALGLDGPVLRLVRAPQSLPANGVLGGVSAFGLGGTNAHVVIASDDEDPPRPAPGPGVFTVSAPTDAALRRNLLAQADDLAGRPAEDLAALCHTSNRTKAGMRHRFAAVVSDRDELVTALRRAAEDPAPVPRAARVGVGFLIGEQVGTPSPAGLLATRSPEFRAALAEAPPGSWYPLACALLDLGVTPAAVLVGAGADDGTVQRLAALTGLSPVDHDEPVAARLTHLVTIGAVPPRPDGPIRLPLTVPGDPDAWHGVARVAAQLFRAGANPRWSGLYAADQRVVRGLAPYAFAESRFPLPEHAGRTVPATPAAPATHDHDPTEGAPAWSTTGYRY